MEGEINMDYDYISKECRFLYLYPNFFVLKKKMHQIQNYVICSVGVEDSKMLQMLSSFILISFSSKYSILHYNFMFCDSIDETSNILVYKSRQKKRQK